MTKIKFDLENIVCCERLMLDTKNKQWMKVKEEMKTGEMSMEMNHVTILPLLSEHLRVRLSLGKITNFRGGCG